MSDARCVVLLPVLATSDRSCGPRKNATASLEETPYVMNRFHTARRIRRLLVLGATLALGGCGSPAYKVIGSGSASTRGQPGCDVTVLTVAPSEPFEQVGLIEPEDRTVTPSAEIFKSLVRDRVCALGGEAIIAQKNGGHYVGGAVIRRTTKASGR